MSQEQLRALAWERAWQKARAATTERLALISTLIWMTSALALYILFLVPQNARPALGMLVGIALLVPASVPWLAYQRLVARKARQIAEAEFMEVQRDNVWDHES